MSVPPTLAEISALAARAVAALDCDGQASVLWERSLAGDGARDSLTVTFTAIEDGRGWQTTVETGGDEPDADELRRAAKAALLHARQARAWPAPGLPAEPVPGRPHDGFDATVLRLDPATEAAAARTLAGDGIDVDWSARASRFAVASTSGVRAAEERSHVLARVSGRRDAREAEVVVAGVGAADVATAAADARALLGEGDQATALVARVPGGAVRPVDPGALPVVLGPEAVAAVLDQLRPAVGVRLALGDGPLAGRRGTRVAAPAVNLSDSARYPGTLPRSYDAEGTPRRPVPLIQDGVAHGAVHDTASAARAGGGAASTGHATRAATLAPYPDHLVLVGGGVESVAALAAPVARGLYVPTLSATFEPAGDARVHEAIGAAVIAGGEIAAPAGTLSLEVRALEVLAHVEALTAAQRLVPLRGHAPGGIGAAVVPALRSGGGVTVVG